MADALIIIDSGGRIVRLNHAARQLLSLNDTSIILGQPLDHEHSGQWPLGAREVAEALAPMVDALQRDQVPAETEVEVRSPGRRILSFSGTPLHDASSMAAC
jgi:PAS domain-containing protein